MTDPRNPRFGAALTLVVVLAVLITGNGWLALGQAAVFAITAAKPRLGPYGMIFRGLVAPRLRPPAELEPLAPVRFAQAVGLLFMLVAAAGFLLGVPLVGQIASVGALVAAFLNSVFGLCLGCEMYLAYRRVAGRPLASRAPAS